MDLSALLTGSCWNHICHLFKSCTNKHLTGEITAFTSFLLSWANWIKDNNSFGRHCQEEVCLCTTGCSPVHMEPVWTTYVLIAYLYSNYHTERVRACNLVSRSTTKILQNSLFLYASIWLHSLLFITHFWLFLFSELASHQSLLAYMICYPSYC